MDLRELALLAPTGVLSTEAAERAGVDRRALARAAAEGEILRLSQGWYAPVPELDRDERARRLALAMAIAHEGSALPSHYSAALLHGLPVFRVDRRTAHLTKTTTSKTRKRGGMALWSAVPDAGAPSTVDIAGRRIETVPLGLALAQTALVAGSEAALVTADAAVRRELVTPGEIAAGASLLARRRGAQDLRLLLACVDGRHESPGETRTALLLRRLGHEFTPQVWITDGDQRWRVDFLLRGTRVVVEFDGEVKYGSGADLVAEKRREDRLRALGYVVVRLTWADLEHPEQVRELIGRAVAAARHAACPPGSRPLRRPRQTAGHS